MNGNLLEQINSYIIKDNIDNNMAPSNLPEVDNEKKNKKGIFDKKNIGIKSKPRIVDATLTAYKLLESAYIN